MIDDIDIIPKSTFVLFGVEVFKSEGGTYKLHNIKKLVHQFALPWRLNLIHLEGQTLLAREVKERCFDLGLNFDQIFAVNRDYVPVEVKEFINLHEIVFAPTVMGLLNMQPVLRSPYNDWQAVDIACYFSTSTEPFTPQNYYHLLSQ